MPVFRLVYASRARPGLDPFEVQVILSTARFWNRRRDVTGALAYTGRHFVQVLEGAEDTVRDLWRRIEADPRHVDAHVLGTRLAPHRAFDGHVMALAPMPDADTVLDDAPSASDDSLAQWAVRGLLEGLDLDA